MITLKCPTCGFPLVERTNRLAGTEFLGCSNWPNCTYTAPLPEHIRLQRLGAKQLPGFDA